VQRGAGTVGYVHNISFASGLGVHPDPSTFLFPLNIAVSLMDLEHRAAAERGNDACVGVSIPVEFVFAFGVVAALVFIGELGAFWFAARPGECLHDPRPVIVG